jgi:hypothetical protein
MISFNAHIGERGPRGKARSRYLDRSSLTPREPTAASPFEIAHTTGWLLGPHRVPITLRHRNLDSEYIVDCIKRIERLLLLDAHCHIPRAAVETYALESPGTSGARYGACGEAVRRQCSDPHRTRRPGSVHVSVVTHPAPLRSGFRCRHLLGDHDRVLSRRVSGVLMSLSYGVVGSAVHLTTEKRGERTPG